MEVRHCTEHCKLLDRLVGRSVLTNSDAVVSQNEGQRNSHQSGKSCHRFYIITEYEECRNVSAETTVKHDTVADRCHRKLSYAKVEVSACRVLCGEVARILHGCLVGRSKVSRTADHVRHDVL